MGLIDFYVTSDQEMEWVWSYKPGAHTGPVQQQQL